MPPPLRCVLAPAAEIASAAETRNEPSPAAAALPLQSHTRLQLSSPTADLSAQMQTARYWHRTRSHRPSPRALVQQQGEQLQRRVQLRRQRPKGDGEANGTDATGDDAARSQPHVDAALALAVATASPTNHTNGSIAPRVPLQPLDTRAGLGHWRSDSASASPPSSGAGLGLTFGLGSGGTLLTNNSSLSNSFRRGTAKDA